MIQADGLFQGLFSSSGIQPKGLNNAPGSNSMFASLLGGADAGSGSLSLTHTPGLAGWANAQAEVQLMTPEAVEALRGFLQQLADAGLMPGTVATTDGPDSELSGADFAQLSEEELKDKLMTFLSQLVAVDSSGPAEGGGEVSRVAQLQLLNGADLDQGGGSQELALASLSEQQLASLSEQQLASLSEQQLASLSEQQLASLSEQQPASLFEQRQAPLSEQQQQQLALLVQVLNGEAGLNQASSRLGPFNQGQLDIHATSLRSEPGVERSQLLQSLLALAGSPDRLQRIGSGPDDTGTLARFASIVQQTVPGAAASDGDSALLAKLVEVIRANTAAGGQQAAGSGESRVAADPSSSLNPMLDLPRALPSSAAPASTALSTSHHQAATQQTFERVVWMVQEGARTARLQLDPPELGRVNIRLEMDGLETRIQLSSSQQGVRDALESMLPRLRDALDQQGLNLADASVSDQDAADHLDSESGSGMERGIDEESSDILVSDDRSAQERVADDGLLSAYA